MLPAHSQDSVVSIAFTTTADGVEHGRAVFVLVNNAARTDANGEAVRAGADLAHQLGPFGHQAVHIRELIVAHQSVVNIVSHERQVHVPVVVAPTPILDDGGPRLGTIGWAFLQEVLHPKFTFKRVLHRRIDRLVARQVRVAAVAHVPVGVRLAVDFDVQIHRVQSG